MRHLPMTKDRLLTMTSAIALVAASVTLAAPARADEAAAKKWIDSEFQPSTLSKDQQMAEMKWFIDAAKKLQAKGVKEISVVSETITTHEYESKTLAKAFEEITGIKRQVLRPDIWRSDGRRRPRVRRRHSRSRLRSPWPARGGPTRSRRGSGC